MMDLFCRFVEMREICRVEICLVDEDFDSVGYCCVGVAR